MSPVFGLYLLQDAADMVFSGLGAYSESVADFFVGEPVCHKSQDQYLTVREGGGSVRLVSRRGWRCFVSFRIHGPTLIDSKLSQSDWTYLNLTDQESRTCTGKGRFFVPEHCSSGPTLRGSGCPELRREDAWNRGTASSDEFQWRCHQ